MSDQATPVVLVVDHQPDLRALLQTILRHHGLRVILAQNRNDALMFFRTNVNAIDVVLMNSRMPDWPGDRAVRDLHDMRSDVSICFLDGETRNGRPQPELNGAHIIHKPFEPSDLAQRIWGLIRPRDRRSEPRRSLSTSVCVGPGLEPAFVVESWIDDESSVGLCLRLPEKLGDVGSILSIRSAEAIDDDPWIPVQVRHIRNDGDHWTAGCQLLHPAARQAE